MKKYTKLIVAAVIAAIFIGFTVFQSGQARKRAELQAQLDSVATTVMSR